ncbi:Protein CBR-STG-1 [Dirofilaria immitis]|nr:Protein CBR-STG-1 [Dirofilaria immitis]
MYNNNNNNNNNNNGDNTNNNGDNTNNNGTSTNNWLYTTEVLRYYIHPNDTVANTNDDILNQITYFKNATLGPWLFCWLDPATDFHCTTVNYFTTEEPYDVTTSVECK